MYHLKYAYLYTGLVQSRIKPEEEFNLINMPVLLTAGNGRVYDPLLARFLNADPLIQNNTDAQNFNRYSYVLNNPTKYTDPSGYAYQGIGGYSGNGSQINGGFSWQNYNEQQYYESYKEGVGEVVKQISGNGRDKPRGATIRPLNEFEKAGYLSLYGPPAPNYEITVQDYNDYFRSKWNYGSTQKMQAGNGDYSPYYQNQAKYTGAPNWGSFGDVLGISGTGIKVLEISSAMEAANYSTKYANFKTSGLIKGIIKPEVMTRHMQIYATSIKNLAKNFGTPFGMMFQLCLGVKK